VSTALPSAGTVACPAGFPVRGRAAFLGAGRGEGGADDGGAGDGVPGADVPEGAELCEPSTNDGVAR